MSYWVELLREFLVYLWAMPAVRRAAVGLASAVVSGVAAYLSDMGGPTAVIVTAVSGSILAWLSNYIPKPSAE